MSVLIGTWKVFRGTALLAVIAVVVTAVLLISCFVQLLSGEIPSGRSSKVPGTI